MRLHIGTEPLPSRLQRLDARLKLLVGVALLLGIALTPRGHWGALGAYAALLLVTWRWGAPGLPLWRTALWLSPFALATLPWLWLTPGPPMLTLGRAGIGLIITQTGLLRVTDLILRMVLSIATAGLIVGTTPWTALLAALRTFGLPRVLISSMGLMLHYLGLWVASAQTLQRARAARSFEWPGRRAGGTLAWRARITGGMVGNLFLRALAQSERTYQAMLARGFDGEIRTLPLSPLNRRAWVVSLALAMLGGLLGQLLP